MERELKKVVVQMKRDDNKGYVPVVAYTTTCAGLVIHPARKFVLVGRNPKPQTVIRRNFWSITMHPLGLRVFTGFPTKAQAIELLESHVSKFHWIALRKEDIFDANDRDEMKAMADAVRKIIIKMRRDM